MFRHFRMIRGCRCPAPRPLPRTSTTAKGASRGMSGPQGSRPRMTRSPTFRAAAGDCQTAHQKPTTRSLARVKVMNRMSEESEGRGRDGHKRGRNGRGCSHRSSNAIRAVTLPASRSPSCRSRLCSGSNRPIGMRLRNRRGLRRVGPRGPAGPQTGGRLPGGPTPTSPHPRQKLPSRVLRRFGRAGYAACGRRWSGPHG